MPVDILFATFNVPYLACIATVCVAGNKRIAAKVICKLLSQ